MASPENAGPEKAGREIELKLAVPAAAAQAIADRIGGSAGARRRHEVTAYFDTPDHLLNQRGMSLRVRTRDGRRVQTLKANRAASAAADRAEWEWPVAHDTPRLDLLAGVDLGVPLPRALDLQPMFVTEIDRVVAILAGEDGTLIEAALDQGAIIAGSAREPVHELELELQEGHPAALYRLGLRLHAATPLMVMSESKAARGYRLRSGSRPAATKAGDIALPPQCSGSEAFRTITMTALGHLLANQPAALAGDMEGVHQIRVAVRRLRTALALFAPHLDRHATERLQAELRRAGRIFGEARDWDVFCRQMLSDTLEQPGASGWIELLRQAALAEQDAAHRAVEAELRAPPFTSLVLGLAAWAEQEEPAGAPALGQPIAELAPALLDRLADKVERRGRHIRRRSDTERHALRKAAKKLRYAIDDLGSIYPTKDVEPYLRRCRKLQQRLGDINDTVTARALADRLDGAARPDLAPAVGALGMDLDRRRRAALHGVSKRWKAFRAESRFWA